MPRVKPAAKVPVDLPVTEITVDGKVYKACFDLQTLFDCEAELLALGHPEANLFDVLPRTTMSGTRRLFAVAIQRFHADIPFEERIGLLGKDIVAHYVVASKLVELWTASMPRPSEQEKPADPSQAGSSAGESAGS